MTAPPTLYMVAVVTWNSSVGKGQAARAQAFEVWPRPTPSPRPTAGRDARQADRAEAPLDHQLALVLP